MGNVVTVHGADFDNLYYGYFSGWSIFGQNRPSSVSQKNPFFEDFADVESLWDLVMARLLFQLFVTDPLGSVECLPSPSKRSLVELTCLGPPSLVKHST